MQCRLHPNSTIVLEIKDHVSIYKVTETPENINETSFTEGGGLNREGELITKFDFQRGGLLERGV